MIYNLHLLRIVAALAVVFLHVCSPAGFGLPLLTGAFGVDLFFAISGFTISYVGNVPAGRFLVRRLVRIVPLYWGATFGAYAIALVAPTKIQSTDSSFVHLLCSLFFIPHLNKVGLFEPILALGWTLNYEMYFYFLFALALLVSVRWAPVICSGFMLAVAAILRLSGTTNAVALLYAKPIVFEFIGGVIIFYIYQSLAVEKWAKEHRRLTKTLLSCLGAISAVLIVALECATLDTERALRAGIPGFVIVLAAVLLEKIHATAIRHKATLLLGDASYVLYLTHPYVVYGAIRLCLSQFRLGTIGIVLAVVGLLVLATAVAVLVHWLIERPVLSALRGLTNPKKPQATLKNSPVSG